jgi:Plasma-membrane choline transporter
VTVAGGVGTWWFEPADAQCCCSAAVNNSFLRTITTSFGSICFGSLIVAIIQGLDELVTTVCAQDDDGILSCVTECFLSCFASLVEYFNTWAFVYVGLYGYSYLEAGKNVFTLFRNRGWEAIIADDLVSNTLCLISLIMGDIMGSVGLILALSTNLFDDAGGDAKKVAFFLGFLVGLCMTSIAMTPIASAVNTIIVLFAEAPAEFQQHYPELSNRMHETWSQIYPGSV